MAEELLLIKLGGPLLAGPGSMDAARAGLHFRYVAGKPPANAVPDGLPKKLKSHVRGWPHFCRLGVNFRFSFFSTISKLAELGELFKEASKFMEANDYYRGDLAIGSDIAMSDQVKIGMGYSKTICFRSFLRSIRSIKISTASNSLILMILHAQPRPRLLGQEQ